MVWKEVFADMPDIQQHLTRLLEDISEMKF